MSMSETDLSEGFSGQTCPSDLVWQVDMDWTEILYIVWFISSALAKSQAYVISLLSMQIFLDNVLIWMNLFQSFSKSLI